MGTEFDGDRLSRGINFMGIICPGRQEVGDRKSGDQMGSGPNASQPNIEKKIKWVQLFSTCSNVFQYSILIFNMHVVGQK